MQVQKLLSFEKLHAFFEVFLRFSGEAYDDVCAEGDIGNVPSRARHVLRNPIRRIFSSHTVEGTCASALDGQVKMRKKLAHPRHAGDKLLRQAGGVKRAESDSVHSVNASHLRDKLAQPEAF